LETGLGLLESRLEPGALDDPAYEGMQAAVGRMETPRWQGEPLPGKTLLLWADQGMGDCIMMMRYLPEVKARAAGRIVVQCPLALERMFRAMPEVHDVIGPVGVPGVLDRQCPIMSLPFVFGTRLGTIPHKVPYISIPGDLDEQWRARLASVAAPRVGLAWAGRKGLPRDELRSVPLRRFAALFDIPGVRFVSLQKGEEARQIRDTGCKIHDLMDQANDLLDTAALLRQLDLVISVDTSVAHLAGALGKPVWLLNRLESEWRWMLEREDSPWYPTMRIFRQDALGDWDAVIARVATALRALLQHADRATRPS
jgi:glycosyl transferase family 9 (putative heptosyltransferase)